MRALQVRYGWAIRFFLDEHHRIRDRALLDLAIDSKLRGCDIVAIRIGDLASGGTIQPPRYCGTAQNRASGPV